LEGGLADAEMLENPCPGEDDSWLRRCLQQEEVQVRRPEQIIYHGLPAAVADAVLDVSFVFQPP
jgi:hypothetical protein